MNIEIKELKTEIYEEQCSRSPNLNGDYNMSCISNNFSSFFLDSLNDPSEFAKYLGNSENKVQSIEEQVFGGGVITNGGCVSGNSGSSGGGFIGIVGGSGGGNCGVSLSNNIGGGVVIPNVSSICPTNNHVNGNNCDGDIVSTVYSSEINHGGINNTTNYIHQQQQQTQQQHSQQQQPQQHQQHQQQQQPQQQQQTYHHHHEQNNLNQTPQHQQQYDNSFDFSKYLRNSEYVETTPPNNLIDLDSTPPNRTNSSSLDADTYDHDSKHNIFEVHNSNESIGISSDQKTNSSIASESSDNSNQTNVPKPLTKFVIKDTFDVHPAHKVEEGIFQHMNKLPVKKKEILKSLGVTFTGHMSISDKSIIVDNFTRFCEEYNVSDHRPFLTLNQSGMQKPEQIKFARYLGQGLPNFTLFCIYSNFKNLFCTKRFENYSKGSYNLQYILDKTKRFLSSTTAELKTLPSYDVTDSTSNSNGIHKLDQHRVLERLTIYENFEVHESHRIEDGIFTHMSRLSPKKQEMLKQFGIQSSQNASLYEKHLIIENFIKFCQEYYITDHRPFLDFHEHGFPKMEQIKFVRYLGQGLPNLTLYKIYHAFKDVLALNRIEKLTTDGYNLEMILKKKKKNLFNRMTSQASRENAEATKQQQHLPTQQLQTNLENISS